MAEEMTCAAMSVVLRRPVVTGRRRELALLMGIRIALRGFMVRRIARGGLPAETGRQ